MWDWEVVMYEMRSIICISLTEVGFVRLPEKTLLTANSYFAIIFIKIMVIGKNLSIL